MTARRAASPARKAVSRGGKHAAPASPPTPVEVAPIPDPPVRMVAPAGTRLTVHDRAAAETLVARGFTLAD